MRNELKQRSLQMFAQQGKQARQKPPHGLLQLTALLFDSQRVQSREFSLESSVFRAMVTQILEQ